LELAGNGYAWKRKIGAGFEFSNVPRRERKENF
jgi:hypothetical protein